MSESTLLGIKEILFSVSLLFLIPSFLKAFCCLLNSSGFCSTESTYELETLEIKNEFLEELIIECKSLKDESIFLQNLLDLPHLISVDIKQEKKRIQWRREGKQIYTEIQIRKQELSDSQLMKPA